MSNNVWDLINGKANYDGNNGGGANYDEIKLESGKGVKIRLIGDPYAFMEHTIEGTDSMRSVRCPVKAGSDVECPLCKGQKAKRRIRFVANVWDYNEGRVRRFVAGNSIWKTIGTTAEMGIDVNSLIWVIMKQGSGKQGTTYSATNLGTDPNELTYNEDDVLNLEEAYAPDSEEIMKVRCEAIGVDWDDITTPPTLEYPSTLDEAKAHVLEFGKHKDKTLGQVWAEDKTQRGYIHFLAIVSDRMNYTKACAQFIYQNEGGVPIDGCPKLGDEPNTAGDDLPWVTPNDKKLTKKEELVQKANEVLSTKDFYVKGGFDAILSDMKKASNGKTNIQDFTIKELEALIKTAESR